MSRKFNPAISLVKDTNGNYTDVEYNIFTPGERYNQKSVTQTQVTQYANGDVPGIKVVIELEKVGPGNPFAFAGNFAIDNTLVLDSGKPFLDIGVYVMNPTTQQLERKGGGIVRHQDSDGEA